MLSRLNEVLPTVQWYEELQEIRDRLSVEEQHLKKLREFDKIGDSTPSDIRNVVIIEMIEELLLSYPVLGSRHCKEWQRFRELCGKLAESDSKRWKGYLEATLVYVVEDDSLSSLQQCAHPEYKAYFEPFDYMDKVLTLKDNRDKMPFNLIRYDDEVLIKIVDTIRTINIRNVLACWLRDYPRCIYPEVRELYVVHEKDNKWFADGA